LAILQNAALESGVPEKAVKWYAHWAQNLPSPSRTSRFDNARPQIFVGFGNHLPSKRALTNGKWSMPGTPLFFCIMTF